MYYTSLSISLALLIYFIIMVVYILFNYFRFLKNFCASLLHKLLFEGTSQYGRKWLTFIYKKYGMQATRWSLSLARGVAEWIYRGKVNGKGKGEARKADRERSSNDPFSLTLQRYADVGERKRTTEKLKWTLTGICTAKRDGISTNGCSTTFVIINSTAIGLNTNF